MWESWLLAIRLPALFLLTFLIGIRIYDPAFLADLRLQLFDAYQILHPRESNNFQVAIIDIDEKTLDAYGTWPWPRNRLAEMVEKLKALGAGGIGFNFVFTGKDRLSPTQIADWLDPLPPDVRESLRRMPDHDLTFAKALKDGHVVLGEMIRYGQEVSAYQTTRSRIAVKGEDVRSSLIPVDAIIPSYLPFVEAAEGSGLLFVSPEADGIIRRVPLAVKVGKQVHQTFPTEILRVTLKKQSMVLFGNQSKGIEGLSIGDIEIPTDTNGRMWIYYAPINPRRYFSALDLLTNRIPPPQIRGKLVLIGSSAAGLQDIHATPIHGAVTGVEIQSQILETMIQGKFLQRPSYVLIIEITITVLLGILSILFTPLMGVMLMAEIFIATTLLILGGAWYAFSTHLLLMDPSFPLGVSIALYVYLSYSAFRREEIRRRSEEAAKESLGQFQTLVENIPGIVYRRLPDPKGTILYISDAVVTLLDISSDHFSHENQTGFYHWIHQQDKDRVITALNQSLLDKKSYLVEYRVICPNKSICWVSDKGQASFSKEGIPLWLDGTIYDITEQKVAQDALKAAYELISNSIQYASHIQRSILPCTTTLQSLFAKHFILWQPRDVVGGDIYWGTRWGGGSLFILGDGTGHGVPGAFLTMIAVSAIERAISEVEPANLAELVQRIHQIIQITLGQDHGEGQSDDGMDLGACYFHDRNRQLTFVGAGFGLFTLRGEEVNEIKLSKIGVGYRAIDHYQSYEAKVIENIDETQFFMTTDGFIDQIGEAHHTMFGKKRFKELLRSLKDIPLDQRGKPIYQALLNYQGIQPRRDDISVVGFQFSI